jgi:hypothetical protein
VLADVCAVFGPGVSYGFRALRFLFPLNAFQ